MPTLISKENRRLLEKVTAAARVLAEASCKAALENLAVHEGDYRDHMNVEQRKLRNRLRARGKALGQSRDPRTGLQDIHRLTESAAYEHWHRLLFTRFLTENHLLITDEANGFVPITLEECEELAPELGARDGFDLACRFASHTLPGVFRRDDPVLDLPIALNDQVELRKLLASLPSEVFRANDALGWTYQFWQAQRKDEVNASGKKIGADELAPVTQLFTEDYMVEFLLHNTLGAWWAGKIGPIKADNEEDARAQAALSARDSVPAITWPYLRFVQDERTKTWLPAAGTFDGWPKHARLIRLLDPCMGSGHFLVFALPPLVRLRMEEEKISVQAAVVAILKDNIHGLELDERCTQIAAFNVALTAWKLAGYQVLPSLNLACSGLAPSATEAEWVVLAGNNERASSGMVRLHSLFADAPVLGSLINPHAQTGDMFEAEFHELAPLLEKALGQETEDDTAHEMAVTARGLAKAAELLAGQFTLVITNVPYLGRGKQDDVLKVYCERVHPEAKADLATCFVERCLDFCAQGGSTALVTPQNWLFMGTYVELRQKLLVGSKWEFIGRLGPKGFQTPMWDFNIVLICLSRKNPIPSSKFFGLDVADNETPLDKQVALVSTNILLLKQNVQKNNPDATLRLEDASSLPLLSEYTLGVHGTNTKDSIRFIRKFWEIPLLLKEWSFGQTTTDTSMEYAGYHNIYFWEEGKGILYDLYRRGIAVLAGGLAWHKNGVLVSQMNRLPVALYIGTLFDQNSAAIVPKSAKDLPAIWAFCNSSEFNLEVRKIDQALKVTNNTLVKVPFDLNHWQKVASEKYPNGLPKPHSNDPTQWLFNGHPKGSGQPLHVAVARLLGYRWPRQTGSNFPDCPALGPDGLESFTDEDGIVCLPPLNREQPAAARLRQLLTVALGTFDEHALIATTGLKGSKSKTVEDWLRDEFFEQHSKLFHDRPFIWHLWDGRADGFHALVNYHKLDYSMLQKLTYSYLGNWIQQQADDAKADKPGAAARLGAARELQSKLAAILEGEAPLDIFVRWKPLKDQSQGWHPDFNDGIRQNARPFLLAGDVGKRGAGLFRAVPLSLKDKDRGAEPQCSKDEYPWFWCEEEPRTDSLGGKEFVGNRWNDVHLTLAAKRAALGDLQ
ncbi:type II restriction enzyme methylase subunit [Dehalogenimonas sp. WBC-2]|nr:type II restriction enzyme methylase subunit [Dehalogenimonas sp. WBC-2]